MRVLIVDDDPVTRVVLEARLVKWGYEVSAASDGEPAWVMVGEIDEPLIVIVEVDPVLAPVVTTGHQRKLASVQWMEGMRDLKKLRWTGTIGCI